MREVVASDGYVDATIAKVIRVAGVSRPTFYDYFSDKDACFLATLEQAQEQMLKLVADAVRRAAPEQALDAAVHALVEFALAEPTSAKLALQEVLAGGRLALDMRDRRISEADSLIEERVRAIAPRVHAPDVSGAAVLGGVQRLLGSKLRGNESIERAHAGELIDWIGSYNTPIEEHRWRSLQPTANPPPPSPFVPPLVAPAAPASGPRPSREELAEINRQRIIFAATEISDRRGTINTTLGEIACAAGLDGRTIRTHFADKTEVFVAMHETHFQRVLSATATAFFSADRWPERCWEAGRALVTCLEEGSTITRVSFIESYAGGPIAVERVEELVGAFTIFLQEGYTYGEPDPAPSSLALEAITATVFELVYRQARASAKPSLAGLIPHVTNLVLAPFLGPSAAGEFIDEQCS